MAVRMQSETGYRLERKAWGNRRKKNDLHAQSTERKTTKLHKSTNITKCSEAAETRLLKKTRKGGKARTEEKKWEEKRVSKRGRDEPRVLEGEKGVPLGSQKKEKRGTSFGEGGKCAEEPRV